MTKIFDAQKTKENIVAKKNHKILSTIFSGKFLQKINFWNDCSSRCTFVVMKLPIKVNCVCVCVCALLDIVPDLSPSPFHLRFFCLSFFDHTEIVCFHFGTCWNIVFFLLLTFQQVFDFMQNDPPKQLFVPFAWDNNNKYSSSLSTFN